MKLLCLDVGGDKVRCGSVENGKIQGKPKEFPCPASLSGLEKEIGQELEAESYNGVAFATAGVSQEHAIVEISPNIQWLTGLNVKQWVLDNWGLPCWVSNDMEAASEGENAQGALQDVQDAIMDTISTGWGGAEKRGGRICPAEPGHTYAGEEGKDKLCGCGRFACREALYSGGAIRKRIKEDFKAKVEDGKIEGLDPCAFLDREATAGKPWALAIYRWVGIGIGEAWASVLNRSSAIERIVYMGKFAVYGMPFMKDAIKETMLRRVMFEHHREAIKEGKLIVKSALWPDGALIGAAIICERLDQEEKAVLKNDR